MDRIEKEAKEWCDKYTDGGKYQMCSDVDCYIAGATAERERCIAALAQAKHDNENAWKGVKQVCAEKYELEQKNDAIIAALKELMKPAEHCLVFEDKIDPAYVRKYKSAIENAKHLTDGK